MAPQVAETILFSDLFANSYLSYQITDSMEFDVHIGVQLTVIIPNDGGFVDLLWYCVCVAVNDFGLLTSSSSFYIRGLSIILVAPCRGLSNFFNI